MCYFSKHTIVDVVEKETVIAVNFPQTFFILNNGVNK